MNNTTRIKNADSRLKEAIRLLEWLQSPPEPWRKKANVVFGLKSAAYACRTARGFLRGTTALRKEKIL